MLGVIYRITRVIKITPLPPRDEFHRRFFSEKNGDVILYVGPPKVVALERARRDVVIDASLGVCTGCPLPPSLRKPPFKLVRGRCVTLRVVRWVLLVHIAPHSSTVGNGARVSWRRAIYPSFWYHEGRLRVVAKGGGGVSRPSGSWRSSPHRPVPRGFPSR